MGTDIHPVVERRVGGHWTFIEPPAAWRIDARWYGYPPLDARRYPLFALLADVGRWEGWPKAISDPRGLPPDFSGKPDEDGCLPEFGLDEHGDARWDVGEHSRSWVTLAELEAAPWDAPCPPWTNLADAVGDFYTTALPWLRTLGAPADVRLVFGFDS
jgi:hypothetical protein